MELPPKPMPLPSFPGWSFWQRPLPLPIFQQFVRAKGAGESTTGSWGLGLPYVRNVAQSHGGSAVVFSDADVGTVFVIDIPVDARPFQVQ